MSTTRSTIAAGVGLLISGAGLAVAVLTGTATAATPTPSPVPTTASVVVTESAPCGATASLLDPAAPRPTATVMASAPAAAEQGPQGDAPAPPAGGGVCSDTGAFQPGASSTTPGAVSASNGR